MPIPIPRNTCIPTSTSHFHIPLTLTAPEECEAEADEAVLLKVAGFKLFVLDAYILRLVLLVPVLKSVDVLVPTITILWPAKFVVIATRVVAEPVPSTVERPSVSVMAWVPTVIAGGAGGAGGAVGVAGGGSIDELPPITTILWPAEFVVSTTNVVDDPVPRTVEMPDVSGRTCVPIVTVGTACICDCGAAVAGGPVPPPSAEPIISIIPEGLVEGDCSPNAVCCPGLDAEAEISVCAIGNTAVEIGGAVFWMKGAAVYLGVPIGVMLLSTCSVLSGSPEPVMLLSRCSVRVGSSVVNPVALLSMCAVKTIPGVLDICDGSRPVTLLSKCAVGKNVVFPSPICGNAHIKAARQANVNASR